MPQFLSVDFNKQYSMPVSVFHLPGKNLDLDKQSLNQSVSVSFCLSVSLSVSLSHSLSLYICILEILSVLKCLELKDNCYENNF